MKAIDLIVEKTENIKMMHRIIIFAATILCIMTAFYFLLYSPKAKRIKNLENEITDLNRKIKVAKAMARRLPEFEAKARKIDKQFKQALKLLPNKKEIPSLLRHINHLGKDSGLIFRLFRPTRERPKGFYNEIPIQIEVEGRFHDVMEFIYRITTMQRIVNVFNIAMRPTKELSPNLKATFTAITYRFALENANKKKRRRRRRR
ncbi:MAG: hypothetical protein DRG39_04235 [Deltaproteobacteria bacterium]|nr:MAG: hypothetical protein DRG39_04235 [Deltaproteobacteria bacterium]